MSLPFLAGRAKKSRIALRSRVGKVLDKESAQVLIFPFRQTRLCATDGERPISPNRSIGGTDRLRKAGFDNIRPSKRLRIAISKSARSSSALILEVSVRSPAIEVLRRFILGVALIENDSKPGGFDPRSSILYPQSRSLRSHRRRLGLRSIRIRYPSEWLIKGAWSQKSPMGTGRRYLLADRRFRHRPGNHTSTPAPALRALAIAFHRPQRLRPRSARGCEPSPAAGFSAAPRCGENTTDSNEGTPPLARPESIDSSAMNPSTRPKKGAFRSGSSTKSPIRKKMSCSALERMKKGLGKSEFRATIRARKLRSTGDFSDGLRSPRCP